MLLVASQLYASVPIVSSYSQARHEGVKRHVPIFVEVWAPW